MVGTSDRGSKWARGYCYAGVYALLAGVTTGVSGGMDVLDGYMLRILEGNLVKNSAEMKINGDAPRHLTYLPSFLSRTPPPMSPSFRIPPHDLRPPLALDKDIFYNGNDVAKVFWRGICCPHCGRLNSRELFSHWECFGCGNFKHGSVERTIYSAVQLADPDRSVYTGIPIVTDWVKPGCEVTSTQSVLEVTGGAIRCAMYEFGDAGRVIHFVPSYGAREGIDEMFYKYQTQGIPFRRFRMMNKGTYSLG